LNDGFIGIAVDLPSSNDESRRISDAIGLFT